MTMNGWISKSEAIISYSCPIVMIKGPCLIATKQIAIELNISTDPVLPSDFWPSLNVWDGCWFSSLNRHMISLRVGEISFFSSMFITICSIYSVIKKRKENGFKKKREIKLPMLAISHIPLAKDIATISELLFSLEHNMHFPGTSKESKSTRHPPYTARLFSRRPFTPSNWADVWW